MWHFSARLEIIGINPFVFLPEEILEKLFQESGKNKGFIPVTGQVNTKTFKQTLLRYKGHWRLYINTEMLPSSPKRIGEQIEVSIQFDPQERIIPVDPALTQALLDNPEAKKVFDRLNASTKKEIVRYISFLKTPQARTKNIDRAIGFLLGKNRFIGRDKP